MTRCLSEADLDRYHAGEMDSGEAQRVAEHLAQCPVCARNAGDMAEQVRDVLSMLGHAGLTFRARLRQDPAQHAGGTRPTGDSSSIPGTPEEPDNSAHRLGPGDRMLRGDAGRTSYREPSDTYPVSIPGYSILRQVHRGGQGVVFEATQESTRRRVAIKVLREGLFDGSRDRLRFEREVRILAQLSHPHVVTIHDSGIAGGHVFLVMDYVDGLPLDEYLAAQRSPVPPGKNIPQILALFSKIGHAVDAAHRRGIVHRDLKPANIRVDADGEPHVLDFGLSKMMEEFQEEQDSGNITLAGQFIGTLSWASPEQAEGILERIDPRSDVYTLGLMLYYALADQPPYDTSGSLNEILDRIVHAEPARLRPAVRGLDDDVETITLRCLAKDPERRYQSAGEFARDIDRYLGHQPIESKRDSRWYVLRKSVARHRAVATLIACLFTLAVGAAALLAIMNLSLSRERDVALRERQRADTTAEDQRQTMYAQNIALAQVGYDSFRTDLMKSALDTCDLDLRGWEWGRLRYLSDNCTKLLPEAGAWGMAVSPDGSQVAIAVGQGDVMIRETRDWKLIQSIPELKYGVLEFAFSRDGKRLLYIGRDGKARLIDLVTGKKGNYVESLRDRKCLKVAADGSLLSISRDSWQASVHAPPWTHHPILTLSAMHDRFCQLAMSPDGRLIAVGEANGTIEVFDAHCGERIYRWTALPVGATVLEFDPTGKLLLGAASDGTSKMWETSTWKEHRELPHQTGFNRSACFSPDGSLVATAGMDQVIRIWSREGMLLRTMRGHVAAVNNVRFLDSDRLISSGDDQRVRVWSLDRRQDVITRRTYANVAGTSCFSPDGRHIAVPFSDGFVTTWSTSSPPSPEYQLRYRANNIPMATTYSPDGAYLISSGLDGTVCLYDVAAAGIYKSLHGHTRGVPGLAICPVGPLVVSGSWDGTCRVWDLNTQQLLHVLQHDDEVWEVACSPDGRWIASGGKDLDVWIWEAQTGKLHARLPGHTLEVDALAFSPDSQTLASGSWDQTVRLWDISTKREVNRMQSRTERIYSLAWTPDGTRLAAGANRLVEIWNSKSGQLLFNIPAHNESVYGLSFSPDARLLLSSGGDGYVRIWPARMSQMRGRKP